ncbi:MAG: hypothetical protein KA116_08590 [Proteobacteria bacterium]|nr:hypothetical protein [Pseudomonadota bacterium]
MKYLRILKKSFLIAFIFCLCQTLRSAPPAPWNNYYQLDSTRNNRVDQNHKKIVVPEEDKNLTLLVLKGNKQLEEVVGQTEDKDQDTFNHLIGKGNWPILERDLLNFLKFDYYFISNTQILKVLKASRITSHNTWMVWDEKHPEEGIIFIKFLDPGSEEGLADLAETKVRLSIQMNNFVHKIMSAEKAENENIFSTYLPEFRGGLIKLKHPLIVYKKSRRQYKKSTHFGFIVRSGNPLFRPLKENEVLLPLHAELDPDLPFAGVGTQGFPLEWIINHYQVPMAVAKSQEHFSRGLHGQDHAQNNLFIGNTKTHEITGMVHRDFFDISYDPLIRFLLNKPTFLKDHPEGLSLLNSFHVNGDGMDGSFASIYMNFSHEIFTPNLPQLKGHSDELSDSWMRHYLSKSLTQTGIKELEIYPPDLDTDIKRHLILKNEKHFKRISQKIGLKILRNHNYLRSAQFFTHEGEVIKELQKNMEFYWDSRGIVICRKGESTIIGYIFDLSDEEITLAKNSSQRCEKNLVP